MDIFLIQSNYQIIVNPEKSSSSTLSNIKLNCSFELNPLDTSIVEIFILIFKFYLLKIKIKINIIL